MIVRKEISAISPAPMMPRLSHAPHAFHAISELRMPLLFGGASVSDAVPSGFPCPPLSLCALPKFTYVYGN
jgi:hypothetical protein